MAFITTRKKIVSSAIATSLAVISGQTFAQEDTVHLETIKSEAQSEQSFKVDKSSNAKYVAPLLDTPKSISVISQKQIQDTQVTTLSDALRTVPGITLGAGEGGNPNGDRPFIRGYNSESSMYVDGVRNSTSQNREMFAVEQVEVTKGSASTLGGGGSTGGSINLISKLAKSGNAFQGSVAGGTDAYARITLDANKDFENGIATRVVAMGHQNEKAGQHNGAEYKRAGIAPSISFGLDTPTRATLGYYFLKSDDTPDSGVPYNNPFASNNANASLNGNGKPIDVKQGIYYGWADRDFQKQENQIGTIKLEHDLTDHFTISNIASYSKSKNNYLWTNPDDSKGNIYLNNSVFARANSRIADTDTFTDQLSLRGKFKTGALQHSINLGAEYSDQENERTQYIINGLNATGNAYEKCPTSAPSGWCTSVKNPDRGEWTGSLNTNGADQYNTKTESTSIFFLDSIEFNPQWLLDLGIRWDQFDTEQTMTYGALNSAVTAEKPTVNAGDKVKTKSNTDFFSYQAGLTFKPQENGSIYASFATSANPVGVDAGDGSEGIGANYSNLDPEESRTFELGTKWDLFKDRLNLTAAIFRTEKQNARIQLDPTTYANIGENKVDGFEFGLNGRLTDRWDISLGYTYLDSESTKNGVSCRGTTCTDQTVYNGNQIPNVPKNSATLWTTYALTPDFTIGAGTFAMDKVYGDIANTKFVPGYVRYDAMARYQVNSDIDLQLNVNNLSDTRYFTKAYASHYATEAEGRNAVLSLNFKF